MTVPDFDVTGWARIADEQIGKKKKVWLEEPETGFPWLFKYATFNRRLDGTEYQKGDDWAEKAAQIIGNAHGVPVAHAELAHTREATGGIAYGVVSRKMQETGETLLHGNELLAEIGMDTTERFPMDYTPDNIRRVLGPVEPPDAAHPGFTAWDVFVGYLVLDALIGNTDRHSQNWAAIESPTGERRLAPSFDHASSLGFLLDDAQRTDHLSNTGMRQGVPWWATRARTPFAGQPHPVVIAVDCLKTLSPDAQARWTGMIDNCLGPLDLLNEIPENRMSGPSRRFAADVVAANRQRMLTEMGTTV